MQTLGQFDGPSHWCSCVRGYPCDGRNLDAARASVCATKSSGLVFVMAVGVGVDYAGAVDVPVNVQQAGSLEQRDVA